MALLSNRLHVALIATALGGILLTEASSAEDAPKKERSDLTNQISVISGAAALGASAEAGRNWRGADGGFNVGIRETLDLAESIQAAYEHALKRYRTGEWKFDLTTDPATDAATRRTLFQIGPDGQFKTKWPNDRVEELSAGDSLSSIVKYKARFVWNWTRYQKYRDNYEKNRIAFESDPERFENWQRRNPDTIGPALRELELRIMRNSDAAVRQFVDKEIGKKALEAELKWGSPHNSQFAKRVQLAQRSKSLWIGAIGAAAIFVGNEAVAGTAMPDPAAAEALDQVEQAGSAGARAQAGDTPASVRPAVKAAAQRPVSR